MNKKNLLRLSTVILFSIIFMYIGYENSSLIENSKKNIKFLFKKIGLTESVFSSKSELKNIKEENKIETNNKIIIINGNSFDLSYEKILNFSERTAGVFLEYVDQKLSFDVYLQQGVNIKDNNVVELDLPLDIFFKKNGGVKSVLKIEGDSYAFISNKKAIDCYYSSIINLKNSKKIFSTDCLPDFDKADFNGLGGAYIENEDYIFLTIGAPEWNSEKIRMLAQNASSKYGKILKFKKKSFFKKLISDEDYEIFSIGHKNPQGLVFNENKIFSVEHGPQGGDEINIILKNKNYGWPLVSYGTRYGDGKGFKKKLKNIKQPIYSFLPSIAPSAMNNCPSNLKKYYADHLCFLVLSLRGMSSYVILVDKVKLNVISIEQFKMDQRLRHFGLDKNNKLFKKENNFYISVDGEGVYKMRINNFR